MGAPARWQRCEAAQKETCREMKSVKSSQALADKMIEHVQEVMEQREEILRAFVAKYGFDPDECEQVNQGNHWSVVRIDPDRVAMMQRAVILARLSRKRFTFWQRFCLWLASL